MKHEFNVKKFKDATVYTLESASGGGTSAGSVASVSKPLGKDQIVVQSRMGSPEAPKPRNFVAKNAKMGGAGQHKDKKKAEKQGDTKHKNKSFDMAEGKPQKKTDRYHINKDGKPATLASYPDKDSAVKDRDSKYPDAKVHQVGPRGKVKGEFEEGVAEDHEIQMASSELQSIAKNAVHLLDLVRKYSEQDGLEAWQQSKITKAADYLNAVLQSVSGEQTPLEGVGVPFRGVGGAFNRGDDERHDLDVPRPQVWGLKINGKVWNKNGEDVTFTSKDQAVRARQSILAKRPELEIGLVTKGVAEDHSTASQGWGQGSYDTYAGGNHGRGVAEAPEDRTSYQVAQVLANKGIKYDPARENDLINTIGMVLVKELGMSPKQARQLISYDEDFLSDTMSELKGMESAPDSYMEALMHKLSEKIPANAPVDVWVQDFQKADPNKYHQFKNKNPAKKAQMAVAASYAAKNPSKK